MSVLCSDRDAKQELAKAAQATAVQAMTAWTDAVCHGTAHCKHVAMLSTEAQNCATEAAAKVSAQNFAVKNAQQKWQSAEWDKLSSAVCGFQTQSDLYRGRLAAEAYAADDGFVHVDSSSHLYGMRGRVCGEKGPGSLILPR